MTDTATSKNEVERIKREKDGFEVLADLMRYSQAGDYAAITDDDFVRFRWFGVYRQKPNDGHFMYRVRVPGGQLSPAQLRCISELSQQFGRSLADITTRQTIQFHWLSISDFKPMFDALTNAGIYSTFACGDTPRNVVSCPLAGVLKDEIIDASGLVRQVSDMYRLAGREFSNLPRKFKSSIAGCHKHCHQPQINDYGLFGVRRDTGETGYGLVVGGGLSSTPHFGQPMGVFIRPDQAVDVARAIVCLFRDHGYREKRTRARLKFLVADKGAAWTLETIESYLGYKLERDPSIQHPAATHGDHMGVLQQKDGLYSVGIPVERGRFTAQQGLAIAALAERFATSQQRIRLTGKQNFILLDIPKANVDPLCKELDALGMPPRAHVLRDTLISCTGTEFCNLAVVETKHRAGRVLQYLEQHTELDQPVAISFTGCPNSCAQYQVCDIGLTGIPVVLKDRRDAEGKPLKVDGYNILLGAGIGRNPQFGEVIAKKVQAEMVHLAIAQLINRYMADRIDDGESFQMWVGRNEPEHLSKLITDAVEAPDAQPLVV